MITRRDSLSLVASALALPTTFAARAIAQGSSETARTATPEAATQPERKIYITPATGNSLRRAGTSGEVSAGFWRTHANAKMCKPDGSCPVGAGGATPWNDAVIIWEGSGTITIPSTGRKVKIEPGLIVSHPKNITTLWHIDAPYLKKFFVNWNSTRGPEGGDIYVGHASDNPKEWQKCRWVEPVGDEQEHGEAYFIRKDTSVHTMLVGIWRAGVGIAGGERARSSGITYSGVQGDVSLLLLEGLVRIRNEETKEEHVVKAGDAIGLSSGLRTTWTPMTPFVKTFFVVTNDAPPSRTG